MSDFNLIPLIPEIFLCITAMGLLIVGVLRGNSATDVICWACILSIGIAIVLTLGLDWDRIVVLNGMFVMDGFAGFMKILVQIGLLVSIALSVQYLYQEKIMRPEYPVLIMLAGVGMMLMISAHNLLGLYMALELQSLSLYVLAAIRRDSLRSVEAGAKYFILGALSSGMVLFGISIIYGFTGSIDYAAIMQAVGEVNATETQIGITVGLVFLLAGVAFKISAVPFHMWTPDVYQGAPTSVTALFAMVPKIAALALLIRLLYEPFAQMSTEWVQIIVTLSVASMLVGAFAGLVQDNFKRLMAYSSIGNMGYILMGIATGTNEGISAVSVYLMIYLAMTAGVFAVMLCMRRDGMATENINDFSGLSQTNSGLAYTMAILLFSMSGIPPMAGFFGKFMVFQAVIESEMYVLATIGILTSVVAAYYYLRVIKVMFFDAPLDAVDKEVSFARQAIMIVSVLFIFGFTVKPNFFVETSQEAAKVLFNDDAKTMAALKQIKKIEDAIETKAK